MTTTPDSPLFDFDDSVPAMIEPALMPKAPHSVSPACVITFFGDAMQRLEENGRAALISENRWEDGPHRLWKLSIGDEHVTVLHSGVGAPLAAALLEEMIAMGCQAFIVCGGAGVLQPDLAVGHLLVVRSAVRDEGTHYVPASRVIDAQPEAVQVLEDTLREAELPFLPVRVWTTDAPYRATPAKVKRRRDEGCVAVDMEASAFAAVAQFRGVPLAQVLYCGDDLSGEEWDHRSWQSHSAVRDTLVEVSATAALNLLAASTLER